MSDLHERLLQIDEPLDRFPVIHEAHIAALELCFEHKLPSPDTTERYDVFVAGQQSVIAHLRKVRNFQQKEQR